MGKYFNEKHNAIISTINSVKNYNQTMKNGDIVTFQTLVEDVKYIEYDGNTGKEKIRYINVDLIKDLYEQIKSIEEKEFQGEYYKDGFPFLKKTRI